MPMEVNDATTTMLDELDKRITTVVDSTPFADQVQAALAAHASQIAESWFSQIPPAAFAVAFGQQSFIRAHDTTGAAIPETDLFAGLRGD